MKCAFKFNRRREVHHARGVTETIINNPEKPIPPANGIDYDKRNVSEKISFRFNDF